MREEVIFFVLFIPCIFILAYVFIANLFDAYNQGHTQLGEAVAPQLSEKPFFQNIEIRVENCLGGGVI